MHCAKKVFWSVFFRFETKDGPEKLPEYGQVSRSDNCNFYQNENTFVHSVFYFFKNFHNFWIKYNLKLTAS